jgi:hypothetical protein
MNNKAQGCQMVYFQTKNSNFGILLKALDIVVSFKTIWYFEAIW